MTLALAVVDDAGAIARLVNRAYEVERFFVDGDRTSESEVRELMTRGAFLAARLEPKELAGCIYFETGERETYFGLLAVEPARQSRGLGRQLIADVERRARAAGSARVVIHVVDLRTDLRPFYARLGYAETGTAPYVVTRRVLRPCHFVVMAKDVDDSSRG